MTLGSEMGRRRRETLGQFAARVRRATSRPKCDLCGRAIEGEPFYKQHSDGALIPLIPMCRNAPECME